MDKRLMRLVAGAAIILLGLGFGLYGVVFRSISILEGPATDTMPVFEEVQARSEALLWVSERSLVQDVIFAGVKRWPNGELQFTYTLDETGTKIDASGKRADRACPT